MVIEIVIGPPQTRFSGEILELRVGPEPEQPLPRNGAIGIGVHRVPGAKNEDRLPWKPDDLGGSILTDARRPFPGMNRIPTPDGKIVDEEPPARRQSRCQSLEEV